MINGTFAILPIRKKLKEKGKKFKKQEEELNEYRIKESEALEKEKEEWEKYKLSCIQPDSSDIIELNIGGTKTLSTSRSTLTKYHTSFQIGRASCRERVSPPV